MGLTAPALHSEGTLLDEWLDEPEAAAEIGVKPLTLTVYRKKQIGPQFSVVRRRIMYSRANLQAWLAAGGTRPQPKQSEPQET